MTEADSDSRTNILFVHENTGPSGGAETNIQITAEELSTRGHRISLLYSSPRDTMPWQRPFPTSFRFHAQERGEASNFKLQTSNKSYASLTPKQIAHTVLGEFIPDAVYVHKVQNLDLFEALLESEVPVVRMVHDHE